MEMIQPLACMDKPSASTAAQSTASGLSMQASGCIISMSLRPVMVSSPSIDFHYDPTWYIFCLLFQTRFGDSPLWLVIQEQCFDACKMLVEMYYVNVNETNK